MDTKTPHATTASFVGTWELESFTEILRDGSPVEPMGENPQGFLLYTEDGIVSAQLSGLGSSQNAPSLRSLGQAMEVRRTPLLTSDTVEALR